MRILKVLGIAVSAFAGLIVLFFILETVFGHDVTSRISTDAGNLVTIVVAIIVIAIVVRLFKKKNTPQ